MTADAALGRCGKRFLFSGDNDFAAVLCAVEEVSRGATVATMTPPFAKAVKQRVVKIPFTRLRNHSLPPKIETARGSIWMPEEYRIF